MQSLTDSTIVRGGTSAPFVSTAAFGITRTPIGIDGSGTIAYNGVNASNVQQAFLWTSPLVPASRLDAPPRLVADISDRGRTIGITMVGEWPFPTRILYTAIGGVAARLELPRGFSDVELTGVNRCGAIVGTAAVRYASPRAAEWKKRGCD